MAESQKKRDYERLRRLSAKAGRLISRGVPEDAAMKGVDGFDHLGQLMDAKGEAYAQYRPEQKQEQKARERVLQKKQKEEAELAKKVAAERRKALAAGGAR